MVVVGDISSVKYQHNYSLHAPNNDSDSAQVWQHITHVSSCKGLGPVMSSLRLTWQVDSLAVCTLMAGNRFWNSAVASFSSGRLAKLFMTTSGGARHMESGWRGRTSVAVTSFISAYSWILIVKVGPCTDHPYRFTTVSYISEP